jgi:hypothetical protein
MPKAKQVTDDNMGSEWRYLALRGVSKFLVRQRVDASAASVSCLNDPHPFARAAKLAGSHQARSARADDHEALQC